MIERIRLRISGRVQGVGYRYNACAEARRLGIAGWVKNLPTGQVELEAEGEAAALEALAAWCRRGPRFADVRDVEVLSRETCEKRYSGFNVC